MKILPVELALCVLSRLDREYVALLELTPLVLTPLVLTPLVLGTGKDITIKQLAEIISKVTCYRGQIEFDTTKPDGAKRKLMDSTRLNNLGWQPKTELEQGLKQAYNDTLFHLIGE